MTKVIVVTLWSKYTNDLSTERKLVGPFRYLIKLSLKMIGWKEQEPEAELSVKHLKLSIAHYFKACCNLFWYRLKPALLISHTLVAHLI